MFFAGVVVFVVGAIMLWNLLGDMCGETLREKIPSPDNSKIIYVFISGCGATTPNSLHYFLDYEDRTHLTEMKELKKRYEFFRITRGSSLVEWRSENEIEIIYTPDPIRDNFIHKQKSKIKDVKIVITEKSKKSLLR